MITRSLSLRNFSTCRTLLADYSHAVIGGGVVGLAVAAELARMESSSVVLIEKHPEVGTETSSRNSEVIHAGLYYPPDSLKTRLCIEGKELIYAAKYVDKRRCGKWIVAQDEQQEEYLHGMEARAKALGVAVEFVDLKSARAMEPHVQAKKAVLNSPTTGIVSAHSLMDFLQSEFQRNDGDLAVGTEVTGIEYDGSEYTLRCQSDEEVEITVESVINSAGLYACQISNMLLPEHRHVTPYYAKGNYFALVNSKIKVDRLVYPCPDKKNPQSLGTHLTIDLGGQIKFGPDLEWVDSPTDFAVSGKNLQRAYESVTQFMPGVELEPTYAGIRPKIIGPTDTKFQDFVIREEEGFPGFINLLGIESPGLTSSMAIAKYVRSLI